MDVDKATIFRKSFSVAQKNDKIYLDYRHSYILGNKPSMYEYNKSPEFSTKEFEEFINIILLKGPVTVEKLCKKINKNKYDIKINAEKNTIAWLNGLLRVPNFYDILTNKNKKDFSRYKDIMDLVEKTNGYRYKQFYNLEHKEMENIERLNRLLLNATYPENTPVFIPECLINNIHFKGNPRFITQEFASPFTIENLCKVINYDNYEIPLSNDIDSINKLLKIPDLYNRICQKKIGKQFSSNIKELVDLTNEYRNKFFNSLNPFEQGNILWLNRFLLQEFYPHETPIKKNREEYEIFIKLEDVLGEEIVNKIKKLENPNRCIMLIGADDDLIIGVVSYIYFHHCCGKLYYHDCLNWNIQRFSTAILDVHKAEEGRGINRFFYGNTMYLRSLEGLAIFKELAREIRNYFIKDYEKKTSHGMLIISMPSIDNLPEELLKLSEIIELEPNKQNKMLEIHINSESEGLNSVYNIPLKLTTGSEKQDGNETLYFDDEINLLWFSADKKTSLEDKDADILKAMIDIFKRKNRHCCRREEILLKVYKVNVSTKQKLPKENNTLTSAISTINTKCKKELSMKNKLIQPDGLRMIKFSRNIEIRKF